MMQATSSQTPYIFNALYQWMIDNDHKPFIQVNTLHDGVIVPSGYDKDDIITLNISPMSIESYSETPAGIMFEARFSSLLQMVVVPFDSMIGIFCPDTGTGSLLNTDRGTSQPTVKPDDKPTIPEKKPPTLRIVN